MSPASPQRLIDFTSYGIPRPKKRPRVTRRGTRTPKATKKAQDAIRLAALGARVVPMQPFAGPIRLDLRFLFAIPEGWPEWQQLEAEHGLWRHESVPDIDNCCKLVMDALNKFIWRDDCQVFAGTQEKAYTTGAPRTEIRIEILEQPVGPTKEDQ